MFYPAVDHPQALVNLSAIKRNYLKVKGNLMPKTVCAAVVKANGYGLGAVPTSKALENVGCQDFFVATLDEGIELRTHLSPSSQIYILFGVLESRIHEYLQHDLIPVLNSEHDFNIWQNHGMHQGKILPAILNMDTGMNRLGLGLSEIEKISQYPEKYSRIHLLYLMSHLACSSDAHHPKNQQQLDLLKKAQGYLPHIRLSIAASEGTYISPDFQMNMVRQGINLYGGVEGENNFQELEMAVCIQAPILQIRSLNPGDQVGYGGSFTAARAMRIAILAIGYADALPRSLSNKGFQGRIRHFKGELIGRISMDLCAMDVTHIPPQFLEKNTWVDLIYDTMSLYEVCVKANTLVHEVFTRLGPRCQRIYIEDTQQE